MLSRRSPGHDRVTAPASRSQHRQTMSSASSGTAKASSRFSFDQLFRRIRSKSTDETQSETTRISTNPQTPQDLRHKFHKTSATLKPTQRPPPITTPAVCDSIKPKPSDHQQMVTSPAAAASVRLCQSPGGRANVSLAIPVTPKSKQQRRRSRHASVDTTSRQSVSHLQLDHDDELDPADDNGRSSFSLGSWRESVVIESEQVSVCSDASSITSTEPQDLAVLGVIDEGRLTRQEPAVRYWRITREILPDVRTLVSLSSHSASSLRVARLYISQLLRVYMFEVRATKWAAYFLLLINRAHAKKTMTSADVLSVRFAVCAYVRREAETRNRLKQAHEKLFQHKMTEYRVAMQCICGTSVIKYGRKGKPHETHLMIENGDTFKWTSAKLLSSKKHIAKKSIALSEIVAIRAGPMTDVLVKAMQKGTLRLQDAKCTLSLITHKRTFDIKARNTAEREWLLRSFTFLVQLAKEHEKQVAQQVELAIMKKMETLAVWKHGRKGRPHKTRLYINRFGELSWQGRSGETIQLEEITGIELGHSTHVFQRSRNAGLTHARNAPRCFSLVTKTRSLDIETANEQQRDWYVVAFKYLMDKVHEKTAAIKREKAEKQLKLIQELCGGSEEGAGPGNIGISMAIAPHA